jgi:hypothetical protein
LDTGCDLICEYLILLPKVWISFYHGGTHDVDVQVLKSVTGFSGRNTNFNEIIILQNHVRKTISNAL